MMKILQGKGRRLSLLAILSAMPLFTLSACNSDDTDSGKSFEPSSNIALQFELSSAENMTVAPALPYDYYVINTTASDPHVNTSALTAKRDAAAVVLSFQYKSSQSLNFIQIFFSEPLAEERSYKSSTIPSTPNWSECVIVLKDQLSVISWGDVGDYMRLDFGNDAGYSTEIRKVCLRSMTAKEQAAYEKEKEQAAEIQQMEKDLEEYLSAEYTSSVTGVNAGDAIVTVTGNTVGEGDFYLCEVTPYENIVLSDKFEHRTSLSASSFSQTFDRYVEQNGFVYDRTLSRWVIVQADKDKDQLVSHARYADKIAASQSAIAEKPASKKGIGDCRDYAMLFQDIEDLDITSTTVNIRITSLMYAGAGAGRLEHEYGGKKYYFDQARVESLDKTLTTCRDKHVVVAGIILVNNAETSADPVIGALLQHPDYTSAGRYSMPNMTNSESVNAYAAALDFLANRYSRTDKMYGRIQYWIMHNEVDSGVEWTNMGDGKPMGVYMDTYVKSMRMCYNIVRRYNAYAEVMASHTHSWAVADNIKTYASRDMLGVLSRYCRAEGDFKWGLAFHCYPQDIFAARTWEDANAHYTVNTPIITYKNLEVLDRWIKQPENMYNAMDKRTLWLSENGINSRTYSDRDMTEQAAGLAWGWKKIAALDGIDAHQYHNWADAEDEFGLRLGLRRFPTENFTEKKSWYVYQAAGTSRENEVFDQYLPVIGVRDWKIIQPVK